MKDRLRCRLSTQPWKLSDSNQPSSDLRFFKFGSAAVAVLCVVELEGTKLPFSVQRTCCRKRWLLAPKEPKILEAECHCRSTDIETLGQIAYVFFIVKIEA